MRAKLHIGKRRLLGYLAGIMAGVSYGTNPLFGKALMESGVPIMVMLFFRYAFGSTVAIERGEVSTSRITLGSKGK